MILIIKKDKIVLIGLVFLLSLALISINIASGKMQSKLQMIMQ